eukprot:comp18785_c0_seq1/m.20692 comp18785_c0_seq1/g.20692  ORF comp18785_c0_seq1/g.20692 comp18785_c0_seq1/m.20692 type:complete len:447 (-) comp18785_c0_seq1:292-1632(-)
MIFFAIFIMLTTSGVVFGYAAIKPILIAEGAYVFKCEGETGYDPALGCTDQLLQLNLKVILSPIVMALATLSGIAGDRFGPRVIAVAGSVIYALGLILLGFSSASFSGYLPGFVFLAFGGCSMFLAVLHFATLFPAHMGLVNGAINGAFDGSSIMMTIFKFIIDETGIKSRVLWFSCLTMPLMNIVFAFFFISPRPISYADSSEVATMETEEENPEKKPVKERSGPYPLYDLTHLGWKEQLKSPELLLTIISITVNEVRMIFYIATLAEQLQDLFGVGHQRDAIAEFFDLALPIGSLICVPIVGFILDRFGLIFIFFTIAITQLFSGIVQMVPIYWLQYPQIITFVFFRVCMYTGVADYCGRMFGYKTFGRTYAAIMCTAGCANVISYGLDYVAKNALDGKYFWPNMALTLLSPLTFVLPSFLMKKNRNIQRQRRMIQESQVAAAQ